MRGRLHAALAWIPSPQFHLRPSRFRRRQKSYECLDHASVGHVSFPASAATRLRSWLKFYITQIRFARSLSLSAAPCFKRIFNQRIGQKAMAEFCRFLRGLVTLCRSQNIHAFLISKLRETF